MYGGKVIIIKTKKNEGKQFSKQDRHATWQLSLPFKILGNEWFPTVFLQNGRVKFLSRQIPPYGSFPTNFPRETSSLELFAFSLEI